MCCILVLWNRDDLEREGGRERWRTAQPFEMRWRLKPCLVVLLVGRQKQGAGREQVGSRARGGWLCAGSFWWCEWATWDTGSRAVSRGNTSVSHIMEGTDGGVWREEGGRTMEGGGEGGRKMDGDRRWKERGREMKEDGWFFYVPFYVTRYRCSMWLH